MKRQTIWKTSILTTPEAEDAVTELLASRVAPGPSSYTDVDTGLTKVSTYTTRPPANVAKTRRTLRQELEETKTRGLNIGSGRITIQKLPPENWADSWKRHFPPLEIGDALLVKPSWSQRKPRPGQALVVLDPGLSFGTGQHPTTEFCLRELVRHWRSQSPPLSFLDIGTGSGILAISAAKLGYAPIHAFDFDPQCVQVANTNAAANRVGGKVRVTRADLTRLSVPSAKRYDVVCANLLANLLIAERDRILARVKPDGVLVVAGILKREFQEVQTAYEAVGWRLVASHARKEWRSGSFARFSA
jgi:ribosomal protein L11 methyltransferase